jgi:phosphate-selective porin OprO/OprP
MKPLNSAARTALVTALAAVSLTASLPAQTASASDLDALREQIRQLDQKLRVLERNTELKDEAAVAAAKKQPKLTVGDNRIEVASADGSNSLRLRALVQADARFYLDKANAAQDGFLLRRARLIFEGKFNDNLQYTVQPEFAGSAVSILDANVNVVVTPSFQVRVGRFKTPIGLEQLQSDPVAFFNERSIATNLTPNRDVGIQLGGDVFDKRLNYAVGVFNGVLENGNSTPSSSTVNIEGDFTTVGRLFATPFVNDKDSALKGLGFGLAAGIGNYNGSAPGISYKTDGQQEFFAYESTTQSVGRSLTVSPQAYYYVGSLGILAEYVSATSELARSTYSRQITNTAYNLSVGYVLTGEDASYTGVSPRESFKPSADTWGAFEVVGRVAQLDIDNDVFKGSSTTALAGSTVATTKATKVTAYGAGLNWYLSKAVRANFDVTQNKFDFQGARPTTGILSDDELVFSTRVQVSF